MIRDNADSEFNILWTEMQKGEKATEVTERISDKINFLTDTIYRDLDENADKAIIERVLCMAIPQRLLDHVGFENIWHNTPRKYLMCMVATTIAKKYVYGEGLHASEFKFYQYMKG